MRQLLLGATAMGCFVAGLFFLRFYRQVKDALFAYFGAAFWILALQAAALGLSRPIEEELRVYLYLPRLAAFLLIIVAIVQKNRSTS